MTDSAHKGKLEILETVSGGGDPVRNEVADETGCGYVHARFGTVSVLITRELADQIRASREKY